MAILTVEYTSKLSSVAVKNAAAKNPTLRCGLSSFEFDAARGERPAGIVNDVRRSHQFQRAEDDVKATRALQI